VEEFLAGLIGALLGVVVEALLEVLFGLAVEALSATIKRLKDAGPVALTLGLVFAGAGAGFVSSWLVPHRVIAIGAAVPGLSLVLAPLLTGCVMALLGKQMGRSGQSPSPVATFRGGVVFAFSMALVRWLLVGVR
jgi:hypothetical protein